MEEGRETEERCNAMKICVREKERGKEGHVAERRGEERRGSAGRGRKNGYNLLGRR